MVLLPFDDNSFDVVLSRYSLCPLYNPVKGTLELYRVTKKGGKLGVRHSTEPKNLIVNYLADRVEDIAWHFPWLSPRRPHKCLYPSSAFTKQTTIRQLLRFLGGLKERLFALKIPFLLHFVSNLIQFQGRFAENAPDLLQVQRPTSDQGLSLHQFLSLQVR
jgi:ubiquinone/menaquinone biosynthesis C-methylase UbiE